MYISRKYLKPFSHSIAVSSQILADAICFVGFVFALHNFCQQFKNEM